MQRQRGELVPIGEVVTDLPGPVQAIRKSPPPAARRPLHPLADQVDQLVSGPAKRTPISASWRG